MTARRNMTSHCVWVVFVILVLEVQAVTRHYTMDGPDTCGQTKTIYDNIFILSPRATASTPNPPTSCAITLNSGYSDTYYYIKIEQLAMSIQDCAFVLNIFLGNTAGGTPLKSFSCRNPDTTGITIAKSSTVTVSLTQPRELFQPANTFTLKLTTYRDPDAPDLAEGTSSLPTGAIIGIVVALFALIAFAIIMCWCYKQGKLKFVERQKHYIDYKSSNDMLSKSSVNGSTNFYPETEATKNSPNSIKRHLDLDNKEVWASLTSTPSTGRRQPRPVSIPVAPPAPQFGARMNSETNRNWDDSSNQSASTDNVFMTMSGSPGRSRARSQGNAPYENGGPEHLPRGRRPRRADDSGTDVKARAGSFENDGYEYDNDAPKGRRPTAANRQNTAPAEGRKSAHENMLGELKRTLSRRESTKEGKGEDEGQEKKETLIDDPPGAPTSKGSPRRSRRTKDGKMPEEGDDIDKKKYLAMEQQSELGEGDTIENPLMRSNPAIRASVSSLRSRPDDSPGTKRKKRKKKKYVSVHKDPNSANKGVTDESADSLPDPPSDSYDSIPFTTANLDNVPLPPEAMAPVFATDQSTMQHYYPYGQDQNGYQQQQSVPVLMGYDANGYPIYTYVNPQVMGTPYVQPGLEGQQYSYDPNYPGYYVDPAGNYIPIGDTSHPGLPGYTSTPGQDPKAQQGLLAPYGTVAPAGANYNSIIPTGTILDDSHLPPPGHTMVRSAVDPLSGADTNQVVWADMSRDPTDPPPGEDNPQITRKTINRVTVKAQEHGHVPTAPDRALQEMAFNAASQIRSRPGEDPTFLSPSKIKGTPGLTQPHIPKPLLGRETPVRDPTQSARPPPAEPQLSRPPPGGPQGIPGGPSVVRDAQVKNQAFRDKIRLAAEEDTEI